MTRFTYTLLPMLLLCLCAGTLSGQSRYEHSLSLSGGLYAASGIGTNFTYGGRYDYFILGGRYFVEAGVGFGSLESKVLSTVSKAQLFTSGTLMTYEFGFAFDAAPTGNVPFVLFGVAGVKQGGETSFAGVIGLGKRVPLPGLFGGNGVGVRYDIRDLIFSQRLNNSDPFITHNIAATVGVQLYF
jgi:hypothetical protein